MKKKSTKSIDAAGVKKILRILFPVLIIAFGFGIILYYIVGPAAGHMTSDCTDSLRWGQATLESGHLISDDFCYAAILPFGGNLFFLPFIAVFGYSLKAQICGLALFAILFMLALWYLSRGLGYGIGVSACFVSSVALILCSSSKLREVMFEHIFYYNLGLLFFCFGFGLALRILRVESPAKAKPADYVRLAVLLLFSLIAATDGLQTLVCFTLPLVAGILLRAFLDTEASKRQNLRECLLPAGVLLFSVAGFLLIGVISRGVTAGYADAYSSYSDIKDWTKNLLDFPANWFTLLGVDIKGRDPLVSANSIANIMRIAGGLLLLVVPVATLARYGKIRNENFKILLLGHFGVSAFILFAVVFGRLGGADWRLTPMLGTSVIVTFFSCVEYISEKKLAARFGTVILSFLIILALMPAFTVMRMPADYGRNNAWHRAAQVLTEKNLKYGYANFWWAESVTMLSDGKVEVANIREREKKPVPYMYQMPKDGYEDKETDEYFLLLTEEENAVMNIWLSAQKAEGSVKDEFVIKSEPYDLRGHRGDRMYVYVFDKNICPNPASPQTKW